MEHSNLLMLPDYQPGELLHCSNVGRLITFVSRLRKKLKTGKMNLNEIGFHIMWILLLNL